jgi:hypothetical protein
MLIGRLPVNELAHNEVLMDILTRAAKLDLPGWYLTAGCVFQTVWNVVTDRPPTEGIKDYDLFTSREHGRAYVFVRPIDHVGERAVEVHEFGNGHVVERRGRYHGLVLEPRGVLIERVAASMSMSLPCIKYSPSVVNPPMPALLAHQPPRFRPDEPTRDERNLLDRIGDAGHEQARRRRTSYELSS